MKRNYLTLALMLIASCLGLSAQESETMYERGATYLENTMPPSPDPASVVKYADVPFTHCAGMAEYDVSFYTLQGREFSIPIGLHYASGGIKLDEIAGVAGLGWTLNAGGCITRTVMDMPDEFVPSAGPFHHEMPSGSLLSDLQGMVENNETMNFLRDIVWNRVDASLDRYSYSVCGLSGSFVIQDDGTVFQLSGDGVLIDYTRDAESSSVDVFTMTGPDGTVYTFSVKEMASRDGRGMTSTGPMNAKLDQWEAPTAWHITTMRSRSGLETAEFTYSEPEVWNRSVSTRSETLTMVCGSQYTSPSSSVSSRVVKSVYHPRVLTGISLNGTNVTFGYVKGTGGPIRSDISIPQQNFPFRLTGISVDVPGNEEELCRMDVNTGRDAHDGRIVLNSMKLYRDGILDNQLEFTYKTVTGTISVGSQDWYGYYNGENESSEGGGRTILCPYEADGESFTLTNGFPNAQLASFMSLVSVNNDGAVTKFEYEGNSYSTPLRTVSIGVRVKKIILPKNLLEPVRVRNFTYENPYVCGPSEPSEDLYCTSTMTSQPDALSPSVYEWQFTVHDTPVALGPSIRDTRIYYGRVTEDVTDKQMLIANAPAPTANTSRTVYEYSMDDVYPYGQNCISRFPEHADTLYDGQNSPPYAKLRVGVQTYYTSDSPSVSPVLQRKEEYAYKDSTYRMVSSTDYEYNELKQNSVLVDYHASQVVHDGMYSGKLDYDDVYHFPIYAKGNYGKHVTKEIHVGYHPSGNDTTVVNTSYIPRNGLSEPTRVSSVSTKSGDKTRELSYVYADIWPFSDAWTSDLTTQHCLSVPVWRGVAYDRDSTELHVINDPILTPTSIGDELVPLPYPTPTLPYPSADKEELNQYDWFTISGQQYLLPSAHIEKNLGVESWRESVLSRDRKGNITSFKEKGRPETVVLWGYNATLPVTVIENASISEVYEAMGGNTILIEASAELSVPSSGYLQQLSDLRAELPNAHVTTYTHIPGKGIESVTDPAGITTTYEYDHAGRLTCIRDNDGNKVQEHEYSLMSDENKRRHIRSRVFRSADSLEYSEDVSWWDVYGRKLQDISLGASCDGGDLVTAYGSDFMMHDDVKTWLPYLVQNTEGAFQADAEGAAASYHGNDLAYSLKNYEVSPRDRVLSTALPGYAGEHEASYETDLQITGPLSGMPAICEWKDGHVEQVESYASDELVVEKTTDADGRMTKVCKDHFGKTIFTTSGNSTTRYVYDLYDRLRAVIGSGIEITDTLNMWRYDYDSLGRVSSKGIPGSVREYYTYDEEDRLIAIARDGVMKEMQYDAMGRLTAVYQSKNGGSRTLLEQHIYDKYQTGGTGVNPKGLETRSRYAQILPNGSLLGYATMTYSYDAKKRPTKVRTLYPDGSVLLEQIQYTFSGEVDLRTFVYTYISKEDKLEVSYEYDERGRLKKEEAVLSAYGAQPQVAVVEHNYDALGRPSAVVSSVPGGTQLIASSTYALQGWQTSHSVRVGNTPLLFAQYLGYDSQPDLSGHVPQYSGMVSIKSEQWHSPAGSPDQLQEWYVYDQAGRLNKEYTENSLMTYTYDARGNIQTVKRSGSTGQFTHGYKYDVDRLESMARLTSAGQQTGTFAHDDIGRMTFDGMTNQTITYNDLDLVGNISKNGTTLVNYSYLANGAKLSAFDGNGEGLMYRGPFVYRKSSDSEGNSSLTLESAAFGGGRLTPARAMLYVTDYLGSVRAVVDGNTGELYKAVDYSTFGEENAVTIAQWGSAPAVPLATAALPDGTTLRDGYTGKEGQNPDFNTSYTDFGARQYSPFLRRWMTPDPLSEKYYGISPYAFCNNNPVNLVDPDGRKIRVASEYQKQFSDDLKAIFGDKVESFSFEDEELTLNVSKKDFKKGLSRDQKALFRGLYKALSDDLETTVVYENNYSGEVNGEVQNIDVIKDWGGGICPKDKRTIVVAPNIGTVTVTPDDFSPPVEVIQNTTTGLFHEIGERNESNEILRGGVIIYENHARRILGLPERPFDWQHINPLTTYPIN